MRLLKPAASLALLPLLGGCIIYSAEHAKTVSVSATESVQNKGAPLEAVSRVNLDGKKLTVVVGSNGCTQMSHFEVHVKEAETTEVSLVRREPDLCRAIVPEGVTLSWTYEELGLQAGKAVKILNPLSA